MLQHDRTGRTWKHAARPYKSGTRERENDCCSFPRYFGRVLAARRRCKASLRCVSKPVCPASPEHRTVIHNMKWGGA